MQRDLFNEAFVRSAATTLETVKFGMEEILSGENYEALDKIFSLAKKQKYVSVIVLTVNENEVLAKYPETGGPTQQQLEQLSKNPSIYDSLYILTTSYKSTLFSGKLFIGFTTKAMRDYEEKTLSNVGISNLLILIVLILGIVAITTNVTKPLENLLHATERIRKGDLNFRADDSKGGIEVTSVSRAFNQMISDLTKTQKELAAELSEAGRLVFSILPEPIHKPIDIEWRFIPSKELGGDAFGYHFIDNNNIAIYLIDVAGHGVGASLLAVSVINMLRTQSLGGTDFCDPQKVLYALNEAFQMDMHGDQFFTIWYGVIDLKSFQINFSCGGHPPAVLIRNENGIAKAFTLGTVNHFIGMMKDNSFSSDTFQLKKGDSLFVYSDGITELLKSDKRIVNQDEFMQAVKNFGPRSLDELLIYLRDQQRDKIFTDDCSIVKVSLV